MGSFNVPCVVTGIGTDCGLPIVVIPVAKTGKAYCIVAPPLRGVYDDYGCAKVSDEELNAEILGVSKKDWWLKAGLNYFAEKSSVRMTYYNRDPRLPVLPQYVNFQEYGDVEVWCVLASVWDLKDSLDMGFYNSAYDASAPVLKSSPEFTVFVQDEIDTITKWLGMTTEDRADFFLDAMRDGTGHPMHLASSSWGEISSNPISSLFLALGAYSNSMSMHFVTGSPMRTMLLEGYKEKVRGLTGDEMISPQDITSLLHVFIDCMAFEAYMSASGTSICPRPIVAQWARDSWEAQARFYRDVATILEGMLVREEDEEGE